MNNPVFHINFRDHEIICFDRCHITLKHPPKCQIENSNCMESVIKYLQDEGYMELTGNQVVFFDMYTKIVDDDDTNI